MHIFEFPQRVQSNIIKMIDKLDNKALQANQFAEFISEYGQTC